MEKIILQYPIMVEGVELSQLQLRRPMVRDRLISEKTGANEAEKEVRLIANLCEVLPEAIERLDMADYVKIQEALAGFLS